MARTTYQIIPLRLASVNYAQRRLDVYGFLLQGSSRAVLVDTGVGRGNAFIDQRFAPERMNIELLLQEHQVHLGDVELLVNSHLHFDHCGHNHLFAHSTLLVHQAELDAAQAPGYTVRSWVDFAGAQYQAIQAPTAITPNVRVMPTAGHTPGHLSLESDCNDGSGVDLIVAQAAYSCLEFANFSANQEVTQPGMWDLKQANASLRALTGKRVRYAYFSHDPKRYLNNAGDG